ncbi:pilus assembly protein PilM [Amphibiibacter pelophylacis]|uniref:Pilus assembly protein PilM n=1 Tax=Amphibiibacter pelophylacis TaxID=1799477 RepID=A0ACC6P4D1_9BURK
MLGLDISTSSVKLVELDRLPDGQYVLQRLQSEPLEQGWVVGNQVEKFDEVAGAIERAVKRSGTRTRQVVFAMPPASVITKKIAMAADLREDEMEAQVESEANHYIPFPLEEVSLDYCVMGPSKTSPGDVDVMIAASRKDKVQDRQGLVEAAGLKPAILDIESHAALMGVAPVIQALPGYSSETLVALFEIGSESSSMKIIKGTELINERDQAFGGAQLTHFITRQYGFSWEEAEQRKRSHDLPPDYEETILQPFVNTLAQEIARALQFFFTSSPHHKVNYVLVSGGTATLPQLTQQITDLTGFAAVVVNPFEHFQIGAQLQKDRVRKEAPSYLTACGLALRRFMP